MPLSYVAKFDFRTCATAWWIDLPKQVYGTFGLLDRDHPEIFAYTLAITKNDGDTIPAMLVVLNFSSDAVDWRLPSGLGPVHDILIHNWDAAPTRTGETLRMDGWQGVVYTLAQ